MYGLVLVRREAELFNIKKMMDLPIDVWRIVHDGSFIEINLKCMAKLYCHL